MRDDFTERTKDTLAKRVGFICSNSDCNMPTIGPNSINDKSTSIGVAAHITAASENGPRNDASMTSEERKDISNGIWLCQSCSRLIDTDPEKYSIDQLQSWKNNAEDNAAKRLNKQLNEKKPMFFFAENDKITENGYFEKDFGDQKIRYYLDGEYLHIETEQGEGVIAYYIMDKDGNIIDTKFPFELHEYKLSIDPSLILKGSRQLLADGCIKESYKLKWNNEAIIVRRPDGKLKYFNVNHGCAINHEKKQILIIKPQFK